MLIIMKFVVFFSRKLKRLNLGGNRLTKIPQKALSILDMLKKLEMQENGISEIQEGDFEGINCKGNKCVILLPRFTGLTSLDSLGLAHNKLKQIPARVFSHLSQLNSLELEGNNINYIHPEAFYGLEGKKYKSFFIMEDIFLSHPLSLQYYQIFSK